MATARQEVDPQDPAARHQVDGQSGATLTNNGVAK
jgi:Na+-transporting NADH:ubiquinone oxidoreductase subunit NqrC